jgi:hypothetical protein
MGARLRLLLLGLLLVAAPAFAANVDGNWSGSVDTPNGPVEVNYTFKADGAKLTGNTTGPDGTKIDIKDGKVDGDKISFTLDLDMGGNAMSFKYTGVVSAGAIALSSDFQGQAFQIALKKATK